MPLPALAIIGIVGGILALLFTTGTFLATLSLFNFLGSIPIYVWIGLGLLLLFVLFKK